MLPGVNPPSPQSPKNQATGHELLMPDNTLPNESEPAVAGQDRARSPTDPAWIIETLAITKRFGQLTAVDSLTLAVSEGQVFGLLGPNGAGKSTLMKMLVTLLPPTSGTAKVAGGDVVGQPAQVRRSIGYVPQLLSADGMLSGYENLLIFAQLYDLPRKERAARIDQALNSAGLQDAAHRLVNTYSGGMIRRLEVVSAMLHRPRVLFLDEPTVGLDPVARQAIWRQVQSLVAEYGTTVVITTHLMEEADALCDRIAIMNSGRISALGSVDELKAAMHTPGATLDDVFSHYSNSATKSGEKFRDIATTRRAAARLG
jgi:ABC-2 type transport system ATP-binding protein